MVVMASGVARGRVGLQRIQLIEKKRLSGKPARV